MNKTNEISGICQYNKYYKILQISENLPIVPLYHISPLGHTETGDAFQWTTYIYIDQYI